MKDGFSMHEIEQFGRTHKQTILFSIIFLLSAIFNTILWDSLSIWLIALGGIAGLIFPQHIGNFLLKIGAFFGKLDRTVKMICAGVAIVISVVFPPIFFLIQGLVSGVAIKNKADIMKSKTSEQAHHEGEQKSNTNKDATKPPKKDDHMDHKH